MEADNDHNAHCPTAETVGKGGGRIEKANAEYPAQGGI